MTRESRMLSVAAIVAWVVALVVLAASASWGGDGKALPWEASFLVAGAPTDHATLAAEPCGIGFSVPHGTVTRWGSHGPFDNPGSGRLDTSKDPFGPSGNEPPGRDAQSYALYAARYGFPPGPTPYPFGYRGEADKSLDTLREHGRRGTFGKVGEPCLREYSDLIFTTPHPDIGGGGCVAFYSSIDYCCGSSPCQDPGGSGDTVCTGGWLPADPGKCSRFTSREPEGTTGCCQVPITGKCGPSCKTMDVPPPPPPPQQRVIRVVCSGGPPKVETGTSSTGQVVLQIVPASGGACEVAAS